MATGSAPRALEDALRRLVVEAGGSVSERVGLCALDPARGLRLVCRGGAGKGTTLVALPRRAQLDGGTSAALAAPANTALRQLAKDAPSALWAARLAAPLLAERAAGEESRFAAYVASLPARHEVPYFWSAAAVDALEYAPTKAQVTMRSRYFLDAAPKAGLEPGVLAWAVACCTSRAFRVGADRRALLPFVDVANHDASPHAAVRGGGDGAVELVLERDVEEGEEVCVSYGQLGADEFLLDYGFIATDSARHDRVSLKFSPAFVAHAAAAAGEAAPATDAPYKLAVLEDLGLASKGGASVELGGDQGADGRLVAALRVLHAASDGELAGRTADDLAEAPLSAENERKALRTAVAMAAVAAQAFPTPLERDDELLGGDHGLAPDVRLAVSFRREKKRTLQRAIAALGARLKGL